MSEKTLLPCPFCGCDRIRILPQPSGFSADCMECGVTVREVTKFREQIIAKWNCRPKRATDQAVEQIVDDILADLRGRAGFDHAWDDTDADIRLEILAAWRVIAQAGIEAIDA